MRKSTVKAIKQALWDDENWSFTLLVLGMAALLAIGLLSGCAQLPQELEWHENGQLKAVRYYRRGVTSIKMFCYDTDNHNQSQAVPAKEER